MTDLSQQEHAQIPCNSCNVDAERTVEALRVLSSSLQTAAQAINQIRIPVPQPVPGTSYVVAPSPIPREFLDLCHRLGYRLHEVQPAVQIGGMSAPKVPLTETASHESDAIFLASDASESDAISISTDAAEYSEHEPELRDNRWYAVLVGRNPGVFNGPAPISNVSGIPGNSFLRFGSKQLAQAAYDEALEHGEVVRVTHVVNRETLSS